MPENSEREPSDPHTPPVPGFTEALNVLSNPELLSALDLTLELEKRLLSYALGEDRRFWRWLTEGLVLAVRTRARLEQAVISAQHTEGHLQIADSRGRAAYLYAPRLKGRAILAK